MSRGNLVQVMEVEEQLEIASVQTESEKYKEEIAKQAEYLKNKTKGYLMDLRPDTSFERVIPYTFYLPLSLFYLVIMCISAALTFFLAVTLICKKGDPTEKQIQTVDDNSLNEITLSRLCELNQARSEDSHLGFGEVMIVYTFLNLRTQFEADDVFSQKTAVNTHLYNIRKNKENYESKEDHEQALLTENEEDDYAKMNKRMKMEVAKNKGFIR